MNNSLVSCDKCSLRFTPRLQKNKSQGIEETFFKCPKCKEKYTCFYTDKEIRRKQREMKKHQDRIRRAKTPDQKAEHYRTYQKEKDRLQIQMKNLREKVEKNL